MSTLPIELQMFLTWALVVLFFGILSAVAVGTKVEAFFRWATITVVLIGLVAIIATLAHNLFSKIS
jgi:peptidoglycan/LPS O-acetylase OafA/YrhL